MQKIHLIGNLTHSPELKTTQNGKTVCSFNLAVSRRFRNANGEQVTDFFRVSVWNNQADACAKYLAKGKKAAVVGELQPRLYTAKDGTTKLSLDVAADEVEFLSPRDAVAAQGEPDALAAHTQASDTMSGWSDINSDDLPF